MSNRDAAIAVTIVRKFRSTPDAVYAAWTEPALLARWLVPDTDLVMSVQADVRKGGRFRLAGVHGNGAPYALSGKYLELAEGSRIVMSWAYDGPKRALRSGLSVVSTDLKRIGRDLTECTVTHERLAEERVALL